MSNDLHDEDATPIATTTVGDEMAEMFVTTAKAGVVTIDDQTVATSAVLLESFAKDNFLIFRGFPGATSAEAEVVIVNRLGTPLKLKTNSFQHGPCTGYQLNYPAEQSDSGWRNEDVIPAGGSDAAVHAGIGIFRFEGRTDMFHAHSCSGALEFEADGLNDTVSVAFFVPKDAGGELCVKVTTRTSGFGSLGDFFGTLDTSVNTTTDEDSTTGVTAYASIDTRTGVWGVGHGNEAYNQVITLAVVPG